MYVHSIGIVHRDIKPENLLVCADMKTIKLTDFGLAANMDAENGLTRYCGTPWYMAQEIVNGARYNEKVDCWSIGVLLFELLSGSPPFPGESEAEVLYQIKRGAYYLPRSLPRHAQHLITGLLTPSSSRLSARGIVEHAFFLQPRTSAIISFAQ